MKLLVNATLYHKIIMNPITYVFLLVVSGANGKVRVLHGVRLNEALGLFELVLGLVLNFNALINAQQHAELGFRLNILPCNN